MVAVTVLEGFYIVLHADQFGGALASNDAAFSAAHPMTGLFVMIAVSVALLLVDYYHVAGRARQVAIGLGAGRHPGGGNRDHAVFVALYVVLVVRRRR